MAQIVKDTFATNLAAGGKLTADNSNATNSPSLALDGNLDTWWEAAPGKTNGTVTLDAAASRSRSTSFRCRKRWIIAVNELNPLPLMRGTASDWVAAEKISSDDLTTVGHRRLIRLKSPVTTEPGAHPHHRFAPGTDAGRSRTLQAIRLRPAADHFGSRHQRSGDPQQPRRLQNGLHGGWKRADDAARRFTRRPSRCR